jgi:hypothetical protein
MNQKSKNEIGHVLKFFLNRTALRIAGMHAQGNAKIITFPLCYIIEDLRCFLYLNNPGIF